MKCFIFEYESASGEANWSASKAAPFKKKKKDKKKDKKVILRLAQKWRR